MYINVYNLNNKNDIIKNHFTYNGVHYYFYLKMTEIIPSWSFVYVQQFRIFFVYAVFIRA